MDAQLSLLSENPDEEQRQVLSVTQLTRQLKQTIESRFSSVSIVGEISNFKFHSSGHMYFALKDAGATISAVIWRSKAQLVRFTPEDGMKVVVTGRVTLYETRGNYQIDVWSLRPVGSGELQVAFDQLKRRLAGEGLFDDDYKKSLPTYPECVGIVTSETGAALQDMLHILRRRFPGLEVILAPVRVQGAGAGREIARAIEDFNSYGCIDVLIVGRGGGSLEDLWSFNEEVVARAIFKSAIPVISAVGHEIDFTIADFVADLRAPTPSAAAELVVADRLALLETIRNNWYHIQENVSNVVGYHKERIRNLLKSHAFNTPVDLLRQYRRRVDELERSVTSTMVHRLSMLNAQTESLRHQLIALDPNAVLRRGYTIVRKNGLVVSSYKGLQSQDNIDITFHDGKVTSRVS